MDQSDTRKSLFSSPFSGGGNKEDSKTLYSKRPQYLFGHESGKAPKREASQIRHTSSHFLPENPPNHQNSYHLPLKQSGSPLRTVNRQVEPTLSRRAVTGSNTEYTRPAFKTESQDILLPQERRSSPFDAHVSTFDAPRHSFSQSTSEFSASRPFTQVERTHPESKVPSFLAKSSSNSIERSKAVSEETFSLDQNHHITFEDGMGRKDHIYRHSSPPVQDRVSHSQSPSHTHNDIQMSAMILQKSASDLRKVNAELSEQKRVYNRLQSEFKKVKDEKDTLFQRFSKAKELSVSGVQLANKKFEEMRSSYNALKIEFEALFSVVTEARTSMNEHKIFFSEAREAHKRMESLIDENGEYLSGTKTKELLNELQVECEKSREVSEMLRAKLEVMGSELVESRTRVYQLESKTSEDVKNLKAFSSNLYESSRTLEHMNDVLRKQQKEATDALLIAADSREKAAKTNEKVSDLTKIISEKNTQLEEMRVFYDQNSELRSQLKERDLRLADMDTIRQKLTTCNRTFAEQETELRVAHASVKAMELRNIEIKDRLVKADKQVEDSQGLVQMFQEKIGQAATREQKAISQSTELVVEMTTLRAEIEHARNQLANAQKTIAEGEALEKSLQASDTRYQVLQQRFDDQAVTLRIIKESNAELQERVSAAEIAHAKTLEGATGSLKSQIAILSAEKSFIQAQLDGSSKKLKREQEIAAEAASRYQATIAQTEEAHRYKTQTEEQRAVQSEKALVESCKKVRALEEQISHLEAELQVHERPKHDMITYPDLRSEVEELSSQKKALESGIEQLLQKAKTLRTRYDSGTLDEEEKSFANFLIQITQSIHEQESISKTNELRRRENTIKNQEQKISTLESTIGRYLAEQKKKTAQEAQSLVDPRAWIQPEISPKNDSGLLVSTGQPNVPQPVQALPANSNHPQTSDNLPTKPTTGQDNIPSFSKLATCSSDDIDDFENDTEAFGLFNLRKRNRVPSLVKEDQTQAGNSTSRASRRPRTAARNPEPLSANLDDSGSKPTEAPKQKRRKR